jgi:hypothetical protein
VHGGQNEMSGQRGFSAVPGNQRQGAQWPAM